MKRFTECPVLPEMKTVLGIVRSWEPLDERPFRLGKSEDGLLYIIPNYPLTPEDHDDLHEATQRGEMDI